jgi:uncharacterized protein (DUF488 family)
MNEIWTVGHSTRQEEEFISILLAHGIKVLADVRAFPGSRKYPHFNREHLQESLGRQEIEYIHIPQLGGRRRPRPDSTNTAWKNSSFRGYADYMETEGFKEGIGILTASALSARTCYMCSEAVWWRCHRGLISDYLKKEGWKVIHIFDREKTAEHPYTAPARSMQGRLF